MAEPRPIGLLLSNDQRAVSTNARHMSQQLRSKIYRFAISHRTARHRLHQVPVHNGIALAHFHVSVEVASAIRSLLATRLEHVPALVDLAMQCLSNLRTGGANASFARIFQRAWNSKPMPKSDCISIRLFDLHDMHRPTVGCLLHVDLCKETVLMNEKDFGMIGLDVRHGIGSLGFARAYHRGDRSNG